MFKESARSKQSSLILHWCCRFLTVTHYNPKRFKGAPGSRNTIPQTGSMVSPPPAEVVTSQVFTTIV
eukprot:1156347-Pelagomonas_calceolata.AAC.3